MTTQPQTVMPLDIVKSYLSEVKAGFRLTETEEQALNSALHHLESGVGQRDNLVDALKWSLTLIAHEDQYWKNESTGYAIAHRTLVMVQEKMGITPDPTLVPQPKP